MPWSVLVALGSNLGNRRLFLRSGVESLKTVLSVVRISSVYETEPVDAPRGSPWFLNMAVAGHTAQGPEELLENLLEIESSLGRRRSVRNAPRPIDLDLLFHSAHLRRSARLTLPHPRYRVREFVTRPLCELRLGWQDPVTGASLD